MKLIKDKCYTNNRSDLAVKINNIYYSCEEYIKVRLTLYNKRNGIIYEGRITYKLQHDLISDWYIIPQDFWLF